MTNVKSGRELLDLADRLRDYDGSTETGALLEELDRVFPRNGNDLYEVFLNGSTGAACRVHEESGTLPEHWTRSVDATAPEAGIDVCLHHPERVGPTVQGCNDSEAVAHLEAILRAMAWDLGCAR